MASAFEVTYDVVITRTGEVRTAGVTQVIFTPDRNMGQAFRALRSLSRMVEPSGFHYRPMDARPLTGNEIASLV